MCSSRRDTDVCLYMWFKIHSVVCKLESDILRGFYCKYIYSVYLSVYLREQSILNIYYTKFSLAEVRKMIIVFVQSWAYVSLIYAGCIFMHVYNNGF